MEQQQNDDSVSKLFVVKGMIFILKQDSLLKLSSICWDQPEETVDTFCNHSEWRPNDRTSAESLYVP